MVDAEDQYTMSRVHVLQHVTLSYVAASQTNRSPLLNFTTPRENWQFPSNMGIILPCTQAAIPNSVAIPQDIINNIIEMTVNPSPWCLLHSSSPVAKAFSLFFISQMIKPVRGFIIENLVVSEASL